MYIEYATSKVERETGEKFTFAFSQEEKNYIADGLEVIIKRIEKKIQRIENNRYNQGQATYIQRISGLRHEIRQLQDIINEFTLPF